MSNELVVIENVELVPFFTKGDHVDEILAAIELEAISFVAGDLSVKKNRDAVKAMVTKVTKSKTYLEANGKDLAAEYKEIPKKIDANRKKAKDFLTDLQARVRQPLTEWEEEQKRIEAENKYLAEWDEAITENKSFDIDIAHQLEVAHMEAIIDNIAFDKAAEEAKEAERLRLEAEENARIEREEEIKRQSAEQARIEAERKAKEEADRLIREKQEAEAKAEAQRQAAIQAEIEAEQAREQAKYEAEQAELRRIEQEKEAERQAKLAEQRRIEQAKQAEAARIAAEQQAKRDAEAAAERAKQAEIQRQQQEADQIENARKTREANTKHRGKINRNIAFNLSEECNISEELAKKVVRAIASGKIPNCQINY